MQKSKMIFTIGPSSDNEETIREFIKNGMSAARLNFSHGTHESHKKVIEKISSIRKELKKSTGVLADIKGPKIRVGTFSSSKIQLHKGDVFSFSCEDELIGDEKRCSISYKELYKEVNPLDIILVDDGLIEFRVLEINNKDIVCEVLTDGIISDHKGVNVPNIKLGLPAITEKDKRDLKFIAENEVDFVAASFVRKPSDILEYKKILSSYGREDIKVIAKIESTEGIENIDEIIEISDGIMIARGDMGVEIPVEKVPLVQKSIIEKCNIANKIVITATQMLDSMIRNPRPTRAETTDVANAILDGSDALMLSGESASGLYPIDAAKTMGKIAKDAEKHLDFYKIMEKFKNEELNSFNELISFSVIEAISKSDIKAIVVKMSNKGDKVKNISKYRPKAPIIAITSDEKLARSICLEFGVVPVVEARITDENLEELSRELVLKKGLGKKGDSILVVSEGKDEHGNNSALKFETI
ncbi:pyruvate kinase [Clostridium baratii]|uniref:pyruvate kinase n=1 Tax=Clostridium baratii TaxID=1561 RepID=UPI0006BAB167|nr:pyruvate kinase [Clostridium baratii]